MQVIAIRLIGYCVTVDVGHVSYVVHWPTISVTGQYYHSLDCETVVQESWKTRVLSFGLKTNQYNN